MIDDSTINNNNNIDGNDEKYMRRALQLATQAVGRTSPNPLVGCLIVKNNMVMGEGFHHQAGTPHAEVHALEQAGENARGATAYVTLEPCSHFGRTPPCADALIKAGIQRAVVAMQDPNPRVSGEGIKRLRGAGIQIEVGLCADEAGKLNLPFLKAVQTGLPYLVYKAASTLDGKIATETGDSRWISNESSRRYAHELRNQLDVILVGSETVLKDNPALTCRLSGGRDPVRVIVDGALRLPLEAKILSPLSSAPCIIATSQSASQEKLEVLKEFPQVEVWQYPVPRHVPLQNLMRDLVARGWNSVLLEGGGGLAGALFQSELVDEVVFFFAPKLIGGNGPSPLTGLKIAKMAEAIPLEIEEVSLETGDLRVRARVKKLS
ncbi:bifunctional diaminohydroxyphosphoribosylaminopyrimidine deaminase/5-amino-6-(5-phosphoribosylamino)uracil reductase RibD [Desulfitobacterium sp.]|uniref:bifunctional diaminohydroxyphosphoribosylaminopyrimidine deaminase/5-amino-6-(5-phosphoribosylamino)uracil reductase RibD n=1 Tax=Desulfitobacterium sp. TaxID=49981 RepID=UPI002CD35F77|nr:bifunctional diaminohydroxyphosphoribosylaminopyrimidine deaminase/5-amino-6-(5-phosphoribosylamino)uracil reductase RibD [Desulfitobacterium sp.]HVJ48589.1 bifunctional diaminohydroxyphosphoribosylaminopyrimidine deaminase/5-amino-6-(5-phosphoribosylamino)uracil reductase RibD [Desulfitobacterium sp.]